MGVDGHSWYRSCNHQLGGERPLEPLKWSLDTSEVYRRTAKPVG
jgi:hypothetical protein